MLDLWNPLISDSKQRQNLHFRLRQIAISLKKNWEQVSDPGLMNGLAGVAIFFANYSQFPTQSEYKQLAFRITQKIIDTIDHGFRAGSLSHGLTGICWALEHLSDHHVLQLDPGQLLQPLDEYICRLYQKMMESGNQDYLHGALGMAYSALIRHRSEQGTIMAKRFILELEKTRIHYPDGGMAWATPGITTDEARIDFGLSHGMASIIGFLTRAMQKDIEREKVRWLLQGAVQYLGNQANDRPDVFSCFPNGTGPGMKTHSRLAWCYGDLGIGMTLLYASHTLYDRDLELRSLNVLKHAAQRTGMKQTLVKDPFFCHGSSGIGHVFNRLYQYTGSEDFARAALFWLEKTLQMNTPACPGWLEGTVGIGLVLMAAISGTEPGWDSVYMADPPILDREGTPWIDYKKAIHLPIMAP